MWWKISDEVRELIIDIRLHFDLSSVFSGGQEQSIGFMLSSAEPESSGIKLSSRKQEFSIWFMIDVKAQDPDSNYFK